MRYLRGTIKKDRQWICDMKYDQYGWNISHRAKKREAHEKTANPTDLLNTEMSVNNKRND
jgi:hypothetical protein